MSDWSSIGIAGAFILGVIVGGFAMGRVTRNVMNYLRGERHED